MRRLSCTVTEEDAGKDVGTLIRRYFAPSSRLLPSLKRTGGILLNERTVTVRERVSPGDVLSLIFREEAPSEGVIPVPMLLDIVYEDEDILAISKPKNLPVHPSLHHYDNTLGNGVMAYMREKQPDEPFVFRPITRLDIDTTGLVIVAKNAYAACRMSEDMAAGHFRKTYYAVLSGTPKERSGVVRAPIAREGTSVIKRCVSPDGRGAETIYEVEKIRADGVCLARVCPLTGRTHQIRVHMAHLGTPLLYDYLYGTEIEGRTLLLHCASLSFPHPVDGNDMTLRAPFPAELREEMALPEDFLRDNSARNRANS